MEVIKMTAKGRFATILIALTVFGCKGPLQTSAASTSEGGGASTASAGGTQKEYITDPSMDGMKAIEVTIPAKWHFQGMLSQGGSCPSTPFAVFRETSPDGLSVVERLPSLGWAWGTGPMATMPKDCLPLRGPMSAQEFLKYLAATMKLEYVADEPVPATENADAQKAVQDADAMYAGNYAANNIRPPKTTVELARAIVRSRNGTFTMKGELRADVNCTETFFPGLKSVLRGMADRPSSMRDQCTAGVSYLSAPETQYASMMKMFDAPEMVAQPMDGWIQAWVARNNGQTQAALSTMRRDADAAMQASAQRFAHQQATQQQMHEQFLATMQRGTDMSMARTQQNMNARSTAASDWVDYALDQTTVMDPNTGQINKVSSSYNNTWVDSSGKTSYQTNDPNANPNGVLPGSWTRQTAVHGDGTQ